MIDLVDIRKEWPTSHRPWPLPDEPWVMYQEWHQLLFAHWAVPKEVLLPHIPAAFPLDTFHGQAWLGITPFRVENARARFLPPVPGISTFPELNVRTYVTLDGKPGVCFFSLDAAQPLAVAGARALFRLPYFTADMDMEQDGPYVRYASRRTDPAGAPAEFRGWYRPTGAVFEAERGSLEYFLTERYCLYTLDEEGRPCRAEIHHPPWPLQPAEAEFEINTMASAQGLPQPDDPPLLHFASRQRTVVWGLARARQAG
jgi:uncharacterized protein YqjF (DUF2071 family)